MRQISVQVKFAAEPGTRTATWTGSFDERVSVVISSDMDEEAFELLVQQYIHAGVEFADCVRCM